MKCRRAWTRTSRKSQRQVQVASNRAHDEKQLRASDALLQRLIRSGRVNQEDLQIARRELRVKKANLNKTRLPAPSIVEHHPIPSGMKFHKINEEAEYVQSDYDLTGRKNLTHNPSDCDMAGRRIAVNYTYPPYLAYYQSPGKHLNVNRPFSAVANDYSRSRSQAELVHRMTSTSANRTVVSKASPRSQSEKPLNDREKVAIFMQHVNCL